MKHYLFLVILAISTFFTSCEKESIAPDFSLAVNPANIVSVNSDTVVIYKGSPVEFLLAGNPDNITFFSGENSHAYVNRFRLKAPGTPKLDFIYNSRQVTATQSLDVLASADFAGKYDSISIKAAKWDTLTPPDMKAYLNTNVAKVISTIDLSKYAANPVYIAYRLVINSSVRFSYPTFSSLLIRNFQADGSSSAVVNGFSTAGMSFVTLSENAAWKAIGAGSSYWKLSGTTLTVNTSPFVPSTDGKSHELWAVSKVIYLDAVMPDTGVSAKNIFEPVNNYSYTYATTGTYTVSFVATNTGADGILGSTVKEVIVKVIDKPTL